MAIVKNGSSKTLQAVYTYIGAESLMSGDERAMTTTWSGAMSASVIASVAICLALAF